MMRRRRIASRNHSTQLPEPCDVTVVTPILVQSAYQLVLLLVLLFKGEQLFGVRSGGDEPCFPEYCADGVGRQACNEDCDPEHKDHTHYTLIFNAFVFCQVGGGCGVGSVRSRVLLCFVPPRLPACLLGDVKHALGRRCKHVKMRASNVVLCPSSNVCVCVRS